MFLKKTGAGEVVAIPLACDPDVRAAQETAAREILAEANAAAGQSAALVEYARLLGDDGDGQAARTPDGDAELFEAPVLDYLASTVAAFVLQRYSLSSDPADLLAIPDEAALAHVRIPTSREMQDADARAGIMPSVGHLRHAQAARAARAADDAMNKLRGYRDSLDRVRAMVVDEVDAAATDGSAVPESARALLDAARAAKGAGGAMIKSLTDAIEAWTPSDGWAKAHAAYLDALPRREREAVAKFELWQAGLYAERVAAFLVSIDGVPLERGADGYPVQDLLDRVQAGPSIVAEVARHVYQMATLGKPQRLSSPSRRGSPYAEAEKASGPAENAPSTPSCGSGEGDAADPSDTTSPAAPGAEA